MALTFSGASDRVDHGSAAALDNMATGTLLVWLYPTSVANAYRGVLGKWNDAVGNGVGWLLFQVGSDGTQLRLSVGRATTNQSVGCATGTLAANAWQYFAGSWNITSGGPKMYKGTLSALAADVSSNVQNGSGTQNDDSALNVVAGNINSAGAFANVWPGRIAFAAVYNRVLSLGEIQAQQFHPYPASGCLIFTHYGFNGTGTQADWSGKGNAGTVTGATLTPDHVPLGPAFGLDEFRIVTAVPIPPPSPDAVFDFRVARWG